MARDGGSSAERSALDVRASCPDGCPDGRLDGSLMIARSDAAWYHLQEADRDDSRPGRIWRGKGKVRSDRTRQRKAASNVPAMPPARQGQGMVTLDHGRF
jgi:hypothetical protein